MTPATITQSENIVVASIYHCVPGIWPAAKKRNSASGAFTTSNRISAEQAIAVKVMVLRIVVFMILYETIANRGEDVQA